MSDRSARWRTAAAVPATVALAITPLLPTGPAEAATPAPAVSAASVDGTVTLITGDRVRVTGGRVIPEPAPGREQVGFAQYTNEDDTYVVPADAVTLAAAGKVDRRLFNITELVRHGYDDRTRTELPLIVTRTGGSASAGKSPSPVAALLGAAVTRELPGAGAVAVRTAKRDTGRLWKSVSAPAPAAPAAASRVLATGIDRIMLDGPVRATLEDSVPQIGAPLAWSGGHTGRGVTVAVVDSGIDVTHPDLADAVTAAQDFSGSATGTDDQYGHGTHVASIVTGNGAASGGRYQGVAPDATLVNAKVLGDDGGGTESAVVAGMHWAVAQGADVVNVSLGMDFSADGTDLLSAEVNRLTAASGALFVVAAGNKGPSAGTIGSPAAAASALTVGAVDADNNLAAFSARGPRYLDGIKPDITAPGVKVLAALAHGPAAGPYTAHSGTSMAAPHVAGAAAILAGEHPDWTATQLKADLMNTAVPHQAYTVYQQGAGRVDVAKAVSQQIHTTTANLDHGLVKWPHDDDTPIVEPVTFSNSGSAAVTLDLAADVRDPGGISAPTGLLTLDRPQLIVPAGGQATVKVTTDTRVPAPLGVYGGVVTATGADGVGIRIPVGFDLEAERYNVTVRVRDRGGKTTPQYGFRFIDLDTRAQHLPYNPSGTVVARLPKGRYRFDTFVRTLTSPSDGPDAYDVVLGTEPNIVVDHDQSVTVDGTRGRPVALQVDRPGARPGTASLHFDTTVGDQITIGYSYFGSPGFDDLYVLPSTTSAPGGFLFTAESTLAQPSADGQFQASPYLYNLRSVTDGHVPDGLDRTYADGELATVHTTLATSAAGRTGTRGIVQTPLPGTLTEYYTPDQDWITDFAQYGNQREHTLTATVRRYRRGEVTTARWNTAVFGPAMPTQPGRTFIAERVGDQLAFNIPMFADAGANAFGFTDTVTTQRTVLYQGDQVIGEYLMAGRGYFSVPSAAGTYRLHSELGQRGSDTSTMITADWTFTSAPATGNEVLNLPLSAIRFLPQLDGQNRAPAGAAYSFDVEVQRNGAGLVHRGIDLDVEASYDDGATWQPATATKNGDRWTVAMQHPADASFVSLRATAGCADGTTVHETIIRAYALQ